MNPNSPSRQIEERLSLPVNAVVDDTKSMMPGDYYDPGPGCDPLNWSDRAGADLTSADLSETNLTGANLTNATLTRTYVSGANLTGVVGADLTGANV